MTDVTGFGLLGHLVEMAEGSGLSAVVDSHRVPRFDSIAHYLAEGCIPGGTLRNHESYGHKISPLTADQKHLLCDPQTSGGLLVAVAPEGDAAFQQAAKAEGLALTPIGEMVPRGDVAVEVRP